MRMMIRIIFRTPFDEENKMMIFWSYLFGKKEKRIFYMHKIHTQQVAWDFFGFCLRRFLALDGRAHHHQSAYQFQRACLKRKK